MKNIVAFCLTDNDFHRSLKQAIEYVSLNWEEPLETQQFRGYVLHAMYIFNNMHRMNNTRSHTPNPNTLKYLEGALTVFEVDSMRELQDKYPAFEGYVYSKHLNTVQYAGY